ncbi:hypothetical protein BCR42DRAFT_400637 [Absidia repens]|uniref:Uncharacterized protein n=1 Tax=Absidia repens TaxID=90262 RepID=A0A1X2J1I2_9FUNG|nr:hypothetical protein BCR42DRAFT_400637 [Absidia repens]
MSIKLPEPVTNIPYTLLLEPYLTKENLDQVYSSATHEDGSQIILAHQDSDTSSVTVYQAFSDPIADYAVKYQTFEGAPGYKTTRMTWIKPSFLWMQYRSGWNTKDARQTRTLAIQLTAPFFDSLVQSAVRSSYRHHTRSNNDGADIYSTKEDWDHARGQTNVVVQWDPQYTPNVQTPERVTGTTRRAIQLGLKGDAAAMLARGVAVTSGDGQTNGVLSIEDITPFVNEMRIRLEADKNKTGNERFANLWVPKERPYNC